MVARYGIFDLFERLSHNQFIDVFTARYNATGRDTEALFVLKKLAPAGLASEEMCALFAHEASLMGRLHHRNLVRKRDEGFLEGPYYTMEYIRGCDVQAFVDADERARLPAAAIARIGLEVCAALAYLQRVGGAEPPLRVIHRDVSPGNIRCQRDGQVKLLDFSIAHSQASDQKSEAGWTVRGTPAYMSPEQVRGQPLDGRSDLFALGVVLWELFAGQRLFRRSAHHLTLMAVVEERAPALADIDSARRLLGEHVGAVDALLARALNKDIDARFADADECRDALAGLAERAGWNVEEGALAGPVRTLAPA